MKEQNAVKLFGLTTAPFTLAIFLIIGIVLSENNAFLMNYKTLVILSSTGLGLVIIVISFVFTIKKLSTPQISAEEKQEEYRKKIRKMVITSFNEDLNEYGELIEDV